MMNQINMNQIEVDEEVYSFLKHNAEPFKDTPNSVLRRFLPLKIDKVETEESSIKKVFPQFPGGVPNALAQILEMIILVKKEGLSRVKATHTVADLRGISPQAVIDKYTRQLGKKAYQIDELLMSSSMKDLKTILLNRFNYHNNVIENTFKYLES